MKKKIIIIGKRGFLGSNLNLYLKKKKIVLNLNYKEFIKKKLTFIDNFNYIINCTSNHEYIENKYLKKNVSLLKLFVILLINTLDFFQRFIVNLLCFKFKNSYKNLLRLISVFLYITGTHSMIKFLK